MNILRSLSLRRICEEFAERKTHAAKRIDVIGTFELHKPTSRNYPFFVRGITQLLDLADNSQSEPNDV